MSLFLIDLLLERPVETAPEVIQVPIPDLIDANSKQLWPYVGLVESQFPCRLPRHLSETCLHVDAVVSGEVFFEDCLINSVKDNLVFDLIRILAGVNRSVHVTYY